MTAPKTPTMMSRAMEAIKNTQKVVKPVKPEAPIAIVAETAITAVVAPMTSTTNASLAFDCLVMGLTQTFRRGQARTVEAVWKMGEAIDEFLLESEKTEGSRYGTYGIEDLSRRLKLEHVDLSSPSSLYQCRKIYKTFTKDNIEAMAFRGISTEQARLLVSISEEIRTKIQMDLLDPTKPVKPTRELKAEIKELKAAEAKSSADAALSSDDTPSGDAAEDNGYSKDGAATPDAAGNPETSAPVSDGSTLGKALSSPEYSGAPLPAIKKLDKHLISVIACVTDAVIALKEVPKIGFDSPVAARNWAEARDSLAASVSDVRRYLEEIEALVVACAKNDGAREFSAPSGATVAKKFKGKRR